MSDETWTYSNDISGRVDGAVVQIGSAHIESLTLTTGGPTRHVPRQLPGVQSAFVNRVEELCQITTWTEVPRASGSALVVLAHGAPGMGKSRLMLQWAALHRQRYPDGQLMVDIASMRRDGIVNVADILASVLRSIDLGARPLPDDLAGRRALYRTWTADKRLLVVIDDADLDEQVESLVPDSPSATVLVSSRNSLGRSRINGAPVVDLLPLATESVRALLGRYRVEEAMVDDDDLRVVADACGGSPLAATICATRLAESSPRERRRFLSRIADPAQRVAAMSEEHAGLASILDESIAALPTEERPRFLLLGLFPGPTPSIDALAALWEVDEGAADRTVGVLRRRGLVEEVGDRVRVHSLVLAHIRQRAFNEVAPEVQRDALRRLTVWARRLAQHLDASLGTKRLLLAPQWPADRGVIEADQVFVRFEEERTNLMAVLGEATRSGLDHESWPIGEALWPLFHRHGHDDEALELFTACAAAARRVADRPALSRLLAQVAYTRLDLGDIAGAARDIESAVQELGEEGPPALHAALSEWRGVIEGRRGNYVAARTHLYAARMRFSALGDTRGVCVCEYLLGGVDRLDGQEAEGSRLLEHALAGINRVDDRLIWVRVAMACGWSRLALGRAQEAADLAAMCREQASKNGVPIAFALAIQLSAECAVDLNRPIEALRWFRHARDLFEALGDPREVEASAAVSKLTCASATDPE